MSGLSSMYDQWVRFTDTSSWQKKLKVKNPTHDVGLKNIILNTYKNGYGSFLHGDNFERRVTFTQRTLARWDFFARRVTFARMYNFARD